MHVFRLHFYAFCHGLSFHNALLSLWLKSQFSSEQYEIVFLIFALRTLAQITSETQSGRLAHRMGCLYVLQICTNLRFFAIVCLIIAAKITNEWLGLVLIAGWAILEGVGSAMCSGADVQLIYDYSERHHFRRNLSRQRFAWLLARSVSCFTAWTCITNIYSQLFASTLSIACAFGILFGLRIHVTPSSQLQPKSTRLFGSSIFVFTTKWVTDMFHSFPLSLMLLMLCVIASQLQMETFFKLLPFAMQRDVHFSLPLCTSIGFFSNALGCWLAGYMRHKYHHCNFLFCLTLICWWSIQWINEKTLSFILVLCTYTLIPIAWGYYQTELQMDMCEKLETFKYDAVVFSSYFKSASQCIQLLWMCLVISPLLDIYAWTINHVCGLLACLSMLHIYLVFNMRV
jgi:hypothetical protein